MMTPSESKTVTSYDVLKTLAVFLMVVDHIGLYFYPDAELLRAVGRLSVPIWCFLIGFARTRDVPFSWMFWMGADIAVSILVGMQAKPNMLLTLAAVRLSLDYITPLLYPRSQFTAAFGMLLVVMAGLSVQFMEYGTLAIVLAAIGYWVRQDGEAGLPWVAGALLAYFIAESLQFGFSDPAMVVFAGGLLCVAPLLVYFNPDTRMVLRTGMAASIYQFFGRYSLVFYALHLIAFKILWFFVH